MEATEFRGAFLTAQMVTEAALLRAESRGSHYRRDYPGQNDVHWKSHIVMEKRDEMGIRSYILPADG